MPVPFAYFHATKLLLLSALGFLSYSLVEVTEAHGHSAYSLLLSLVVFVVISGTSAQDALRFDERVRSDSISAGSSALNRHARCSTPLGWLRLDGSAT